MTRTRRAADVRRQEILRAAVEELQRTGFAATRVGDVAEALGVSAALIHYHFESKERLLAEAFRHAAEQDLQRLAGALGSPGSAAERLREVVHLYAPEDEGSLAWSLWIDAWSASLRWPELREVSAELTTAWQDAFQQLISEGTRNGEFTCEDATAAAWRIVAILDGLSVRVLLQQEVGLDDLHALIAAAVERELGSAIVA